MNKATKTYSVSLNLALSTALEKAAARERISPSLKIVEILEDRFLKADDDDFPSDAKAELLLLRELREAAIDKMWTIEKEDGFSEDITLKTFQACQSDPAWLANYETYIRGGALSVGNVRKTNANQTIGSRIKTQLRADDKLKPDGRPDRGKAPAGTIIQTYQLLRASKP